MKMEIFDEGKVLDHLKHYLPSQTPLKDFIHHNSLHAYQHMKFYDGIFTASKKFGYQVTLQLSEYRELYSMGRIKDDVLERVITESKGAETVALWKDKLLNQPYDTCNNERIGLLRANWKKQHEIDLDNLVQPLLFRILCSYLDQGVSIWKFPIQDGGFIASLQQLEKESYTSIFKTPRAKEWLLNKPLHLTDLLETVVGDTAYFEQYLFDQQFSHRGWSGMVGAIEQAPHSLLDSRKISLRELIIFELLLEIDALDFSLGNHWKPLCSVVASPPLNLFEEVASTELQEVFRLFQDAFEWSYYDGVIAGLKLGKSPEKKEKTTSFQALFCIDERECSLRRHIENIDPHCETLGTPGFFGVEFYLQPENGNFYDKLCPAPVTPKYLIKEFGVTEKRKHDHFYTPHTHTFFGGILAAIGFGVWAAVRLLQNIFRPVMSPAISNAFAHMNKESQLTIENSHIEDRENGLQIGFTIEEMATRVEGVLRGIGLTKNFAPIVYVMAHGSSSANNPHHGAHDCGACSGRPGSVNARVLSFMANHFKVRQLLLHKGIAIPIETQFIGGLHDTAADQISYYDEQILSGKNVEFHSNNISSFEKALDLNALERSRRFASINSKMGLQKVRKEIQKRSVSMFEPRPELGHGTNTLCVIGNRDLTKGLFLDRRAFLNSYDHSSDPKGELLTGIMRPIGPVCGGINLEYYFSRVDNYKLGAGTKLPHNVMGLIGVANSSDGDLRPGLPLQMIEVHDPVRLLVIVEHFPDVVLKTIQSAPEMYEWYINEWIHLMVVNPETKEFFYFKNGSFISYQPLTRSVEVVKDTQSLIENAGKMESNYIVDATKENLPVFSLN
jgi:uncharacterized protein YbcC (UPF0753/DUF2309 family)